MVLLEYIYSSEDKQMKNKRQFIAGFLTCLILLSAIFISAFAEGFTVLLNPFPYYSTEKKQKLKLITSMVEHSYL